MQGGEPRCVPDASRMVAVTGGCQHRSVAWAEQLAVAVPQRSPVFVNVGANKGYNAAAFMALWSLLSVTESGWHRHVVRFANDRNESELLATRPCGECNPHCIFCEGRKCCRHVRGERGGCLANPMRHLHPRRVPGATAHMLELQASNRELLRYVVNATGAAGHMLVHDVGASNESRVVVIKTRAAGAENGALSSLSTGGGRTTETVQILPLDVFFEAQGIRNVYHVSVDTEGYDPLVLRGMHETLQQRRVTLLEFEYSGKGHWASGTEHTLERTLQWLGGMGYFCYWQAPRDLIPASSPCWLPSFERRKWSNLVCTHDATVHKVLQAIVTTGSSRRQSECSGNARKRGRAKDGNWCGRGGRTGRGAARRVNFAHG